jgi:DNA (cytosine-5)-methyltransferase 1
MPSLNPTEDFTFIDLFAGVGGFALAMHAHSGRCLASVEIDSFANKIYSANHHVSPLIDVRDVAGDDKVALPKADVLTAGFPCQPFSKSGKQLGMRDATRGTLFHNINNILNSPKRPTVIILENVRNLYGSRHKQDWETIVSSIRSAGYRISSQPTIVSPHQLPRSLGGTPQHRTRLFITATYNPRQNSEIEFETPEPAITTSNLRTIAAAMQDWDILAELPAISRDYSGTRLSQAEELWLECWNDLVETLQKDNRLPSFPLWADSWRVEPGSDRSYESLPKWKQKFLSQNRDFYIENEQTIESWFSRHPEFFNFPNSRRKFEWQAGTTKRLWDCSIQLRPSGIRVKKLNYSPALVAIAQTPILGPLKRRLTVDECAMLQGFHQDFDWLDQRPLQSMKQLGNAVNVGVVKYVFEKHVQRDMEILRQTASGRRIIKSIQNNSPAKSS